MEIFKLKQEAARCRAQKEKFQASHEKACESLNKMMDEIIQPLVLQVTKRDDEIQLLRSTMHQL